MGKKSRIEPRYKPQAFEAITGPGKRNRSANIYNTMIESPAWQKLTKSQRLLYIYMKLQYFDDSREKVSDESPVCFYFNQRLWKDVYGLYSNKNAYYRDRDALIQHGFIERVDIDPECLGNVKPKAVYRYSWKWQNDP